MSPPLPLNNQYRTMGGTSFNFFGGQADPLLSGQNVNECIKALEGLQAGMEQKKQQLMQMAQQQQQQPQQQQSQTPVWDEIDRLLADLSDKEFERVASDAAFVESQQNIMAILQAVQMKMMRPMVESTPEGKKALEEHMQLVKHLKRSVHKEVDAEMKDFEEYRAHYAHLSWEEYQAQKAEHPKKGGKR